MGTWSKVVLSGSTNGQGVAITGLTPSTGNLIHTPASGNGLDEVIIYAYNSATTARELGIAIGPTTNVGSRFVHTLPAGDKAGLQPIVPGLTLNATTCTVRMYATAADIINVFGWVNRYAT